MAARLKTFHSSLNRSHQMERARLSVAFQSSMCKTDWHRRPYTAPTTEAPSPDAASLWGNYTQWRNYNFCPPPANISE